MPSFSDPARPPLFATLTWRRSAILFAAAAMFGATSSQAQPAVPYPSKPVRIISNFPAGGPTDVLARIVAEGLQKELRQPFIVDNRAGAGGNLGAEAVARSAADGYTVLMSIDTPFTVNPGLYRAMSFKLENFKPVMVMASSGLLFGISPGLGAKTVADFIAMAKTRTMNFSSAGNGSPGHLDMALLAKAADIQAVHVPYKGAAPATLALLSGEVQAGVLTTPGLLPHVQAGKVQALAVTSRVRSALLPQVPTVAEVGLKAMEFEVLQLAFVPAGTPDAVVATLQTAIAKVLQQPETKAKLDALDLQIAGTTGAAVDEQLRALQTRYAAVIKSTGMTVD